MEAATYTIGELARGMGINPRTIDFYTRQGLLHPKKSASDHGYRHYTEDDRRRVLLIKQLQAKKFSLQEIQQAFQGPKKQRMASALDAIEGVALDLERLKDLVQKTCSHAQATDQPALRIVATEALQKATMLCSLLITLIREMPFS
jgi:MerR family transcriptional regulator, copper efflux regulator